MAHGLDYVETERAAALPRTAADRILASVNDLVVKTSSAALVAAGFVLTYSVIVRYFLKISTDWQDETSHAVLQVLRQQPGRRCVPERAKGSCGEA